MLLIFQLSQQQFQQQHEISLQSPISRFSQPRAGLLGRLFFQQLIYLLFLLRFMPEFRLFFSPLISQPCQLQFMLRVLPSSLPQFSQLLALRFDLLDAIFWEQQFFGFLHSSDLPRAYFSWLGQFRGLCRLQLWIFWELLTWWFCLHRHLPRASIFWEQFQWQSWRLRARPRYEISWERFLFLGPRDSWMEWFIRSVGGGVHDK